MKVLILGGAGFIGSHIVDIFLSNDWSVTVFDRNLEIYRKPLVEVDYRIGDFGNRGELEKVVSESFDIIVHCISSTSPKSSNDDPEYDISSNLIETVNLLDICTKYHNSKLIYISSGGTVYGESDGQTAHKESDSMAPICSYAINKIAVEHYLYMYHKLYGLRYSTLRISNPYGPRQNPKANLGAVTIFAERIMAGKTIEIWGDGSVVRDFIYVTDVASAVYNCAIHSANGTYNIGSEIGYSLNSLVSEIENLLNKKANVVFLGKRKLDVNYMVLDSSYAKNNIDWSAKVTLRDGLIKLIEWLGKLNVS